MPSPTNNQSFAMTNLVANKLLIPVLKSRVGARLGRRLAVVEYQGRRTGEHHQLVTQYAKDERTVRIEVGMAKRKTWWRNFRVAQPLHLRLAGHDYDAMAQVSIQGDVVAVVAEIGDLASGSRS